uniref:Putative brain-enriched guanylate kinase-associated protein n=1 Tax=Amblyomma sculptum TaxID=1581419 RepID=A0A1E1XIY3_AMBSC
MKCVCQECGCVCESCVSGSNSLHLHQEIEALKRQLLERDCHIVRMETQVLEGPPQGRPPGPPPPGAPCRQEACQDRWQRLQDGYRKLQKVNQGLEDKLLRVVDRCETEKNALSRDLQELTARLVDAQLALAQLREENEQYRNDCSVAVQLLQCKPSNFVASKYSTLPNELQEKVRNHLGSRSQRTPPEARVIRVPMPTFPPTAMVYSVSPEETTPAQQQQDGNGPLPDYISAAVMAKVLEERARERRRSHPSKGTQASLCCSTRSSSQYCAGDGAVHQQRTTETLI